MASFSRRYEVDKAYLPVCSQRQLTVMTSAIKTICNRLGWKIEMFAIAATGHSWCSRLQPTCKSIILIYRYSRHRILFAVRMIHGSKQVNVVYMVMKANTALKWESIIIRAKYIRHHPVKGVTPSGWFDRHSWQQKCNKLPSLQYGNPSSPSSSYMNNSTLPPLIDWYRPCLLLSWSRRQIKRQEFIYLFLLEQRWRARQSRPAPWPSNRWRWSGTGVFCTGLAG